MGKCRICAKCGKMKMSVRVRMLDGFEVLWCMGCFEKWCRKKTLSAKIAKANALPIGV